MQAIQYGIAVFKIEMMFVSIFFFKAEQQKLLKVAQKLFCPWL